MKMNFLFLMFIFSRFSFTIADKSVSNNLPPNHYIVDNANCGDSEYNLGQGICLEKGYEKGEAPNKTRMVVFIAIERLVVRDADADRKTLSFEFLLTMKWSDPRIKANFTDMESEKDIRNNWASKIIWKPPISIYRLTDRKAMIDSINLRKFVLLPTVNDLMEGVDVKWKFGGLTTVYCFYDLAKYPLDTQNCLVRFYGSGSTKLIFSVLRFANTKYNKHNDLTRSYFGAGFEVSTKLMNNSFQNQFESSLRLRRLIQPFLFKYYLPTIIIVIIAGLGFLFPLTVLPGRVTLGVTLFLTLTNLFIHQMVTTFKSF